MTKLKKLVLETTLKTDMLYDLDGKITDIISTLQKYLNEIPEAYRHSARIEVKTFWDNTTAHIIYNHPETDEDYNKRVSEETAKENDRKSKREAAELAELTRLKKKYEK